VNNRYSLPSEWSLASPVAELASDEVHIWGVNLEVTEFWISQLEGTLSVEEKERAGRFYFERDRRAFTVGRGLLRTFLGCYLGKDPTKIEFEYNRYGKPLLSAGDGIQFNVSHSGNIALLAFVRDRGIGVDVEYKRPEADYIKIAERVFSSEELAELASLPGGRRQEAFFNGWSRKEAYIKAHGQGVSLPLDQIVVSISPDEPAQLLNIKGTFDTPARWQLRELKLGPYYAAAVIVEGSGWQLVCRQWSPDNYFNLSCATS
jgi:4'-phosphopantetheinyl transferase